ncbi:hypothetical protein L6164_024216 [Bauhinia variegata]|uniref:Uncharacterized protein n=1 Tax=Bauhinia variegata TaxID=167791 RepID=A0ACB9LY92_BAUVA|nr:hypothetical protein L6164_024216 [Bauhinia variegata]
MGKGNASALGRLKRAVKKLKFLLALWRMPSNSHVAAAGAICKQRWCRFNHGRSLQSCFNNDEFESNRKYKIREYTSTTWHEYSDRDNDEIDVDKRAETFIANFRRQLTLERQVSLESSSCKRDSFEDDIINYNY